MYDSMVNFKMSSGINVSVDRGDIKGVNPCEIEFQIKELFRVKKKYESKELIELSLICDCMWDIIFCGINKESREMSFKLC